MRISLSNQLPMRATPLTGPEAAAVFGGCLGAGALCEESKECCADQNLKCRRLIYSASDQGFCRVAN